MNDIVERLRAHMGKADIGDILPDCREAADEIERLRCPAQNQKTRCEECNLLQPCPDPHCPNAPSLDPETSASYRRIYDKMQRGKVSADDRTRRI